MQRLITVGFFLAIQFSIYAQIQLQGEVVDATDRPVSNAFIQLWPGGESEVTNKNGRFEFSSLKPGSYRLQISDQTRTATRLLDLRQDTSIYIQLIKSLQIDEVVVRAIRSGASHPTSRTMLEDEEIEERDFGQDVPYLLQFTPSMVVTSDAGTGIGYTGMRIRGTDPTRINVTINGIPLNDAESQNVFWVDLPDILSSARDVQIQRGVGTSTYGAAAFGASVNISTNSYRPEPYGRLEASYGSFDTYKTSVNFGTGLLSDHFTLDGRLSYIQSDGYIDRASSDLKSFLVSGNWLGEDENLRFNVFSGSERTYQAWYGISADLLDDEDSRTFNPAGTQKPGDPYEDQVDDYTQTHYQLFYNKGLSEWADWGVALHYTRGEGFFEEYEADQFLPDYQLEPVNLGGDTIFSGDVVRRRWLDNHFGGFVSSINYQAGESLELVLGGGWNLYDGLHFGEAVWSEYFVGAEPDQRYYENEAEKRDWNAYLKANWELTERASVFGDLQVRGIRYQFAGLTEEGMVLPQEVDHFFFNPKAGFAYSLNPRNSLFLSLGVASKEPNRDDYVDSSPASRPESETLYDAELGWEIKGRSSGLQANMYYMYYRDQLVLTGMINDVGAYTRTNVDKSYRLGLELVGRWEFSDKFGAEFNTTLSRNRIIEFVEFVDVYDEAFNFTGQRAIDRGDSELSFSPEIISAAAINYNALDLPSHDLDVKLQWKYVGEQYIGNSGDASNRLEAYHFANLELRYETSLLDWADLDLTFGLRNIYDHLYASNAWSYRYAVGEEIFLSQGFYPQADRNYYLKLALEF